MTGKIDEVLQSAVARGDVPGVVALAARADGVFYEGAAGERAAGAGDPITPDTTFRIASMTKMVTTTAALQLVEQGKLDLDAPVATYRPEFADLQVLDGFDGDTPRLRAPRARPPSASSRATRRAWRTGSGTPTSSAGRSSPARQRARRHRRRCSRRRWSPIPGTRFEYGINTDWLGRVVEAASGQTLDAYFDEHILGPLGMEQTTFHPDDQQRERPRRRPPARRGDGNWEATDIDWSIAPD